MKKRVFLAIAVTIAFIFCGCRRAAQPQNNVGKVFGTYFSIKYTAPENYGAEFDSLFTVVNKSLSTFDTSSVISRINRSDTAVIVDYHFATVCEDALYVSRATDGAFDMTVAPLVNLWGFGYDPSDTATLKTQAEIDSIKQFVGYDKISLEGGRFYKSDPRIKLDASAIAKGYACDLVGDFLDSRSVENYLVDIGGEMVAHGVNSAGVPWRVGIVSPVDDASQLNTDVESIISLDNRALATSGNYRQFYITKERKVSHTIDPVTGYPTNHKLLSASVLANTCAIADAYATSFMVIGDTARIRDIIKASKYDLEAVLIVDSAGHHKQIIMAN
ncbi:MAG: FAD:protein FMN transferase [Paludibacteraceae bacterium]|nr:FAD:protein FMN transferase [Paludibacteraceae bacterium]